MLPVNAAGHYYCTHEGAGYCDRRSGTCFCFNGYQGLECADCRPTHYKDGVLCKPKKLCPQDCSGSGQCDYATGVCHCDDFSTGVDCSVRACSSPLSPWPRSLPPPRLLPASHGLPPLFPPSFLPLCGALT
jgi:hypothetical protein